MKIRILGCGPSNGVPSLARGFGETDAQNPKNRRTRCSALITTDEGLNILIDTSPDVRYQLLKAQTPKIDAILYTHCHYDHMSGANDLTALFWDTKVPVYLSQTDAEQLKYQLSYLFQKNISPFELHIIEPHKSFKIGNTLITPIKQYHGDLISIGYRIGNLGYSTDLKAMDEIGFEILKGIKTWILGVVSPNRRPDSKGTDKHIHLNEALHWIEVINPEKTIITHMGQRMDYAKLSEELPNNIRPAYDGLEFEV